MMIFTVSIFVISLVTAEQRRQHILSEFKKYDINFNFYDAVTPDTLNSAANSIGLDLSQIGLSPGEIACLLSHLMLWKRAVESEMDYIVIFEDDIYLGRSSEIFLNDFSWIPSDIDIIKLEAFDKKVDMSFFPRSLGKGRYLYQLKSMHLGGAGYILSREAAKSLLAYITCMPNLVAIDHILFEHYLQDGEYKIYQMTPAICVQDFYIHKAYDNFPSQLEADRAVRLFKSKKNIHRKQKLNLLFKIRREVLRLFYQLLKMTRLSAYRTVKFK